MSGAPVRYFTSIDSGLTCKQQSRRVSLSRDKHSSLLRPRVFAPGNMFEGKARSLLLSGAPESYFSWVDSGLTSKEQTRLERLSMDKHSGLLRLRVFAHGKPFQPCLMFVGKARSLPLS